MTTVSEETLARLKLLIAGQGDSRLVGQAVAKFGSASKAITASALRSRLRLGLNENTAKQATRELAAAHDLGASLIDADSGPIRLEKNPPIIFSIKGQWPTSPCVAIVGSRDADAYGIEIARTIAGALAQVGVTIISGAAHGIDAAAQNAALDAGGHTLAFLGFGIAHRAATVPAELLDRLFAQGTVVSEFLPTAKGSKTSYLERNRLIAAMADVVVVVQARAKSGSLNTARHAKRIGRPVYAIPGNVGSSLSEGTNSLIANGNALLLSHMGTLGRILEKPELRRVNWPAKSIDSRATDVSAMSSAVPAQMSQLDKALTAIERAGGSLDRVSLAKILDLTLPQLDELLVELELDGRLTKDPTGRYIAPS